MIFNSPNPNNIVSFLQFGEVIVNSRLWNGQRRNGIKSKDSKLDEYSQKEMGGAPNSNAPLDFVATLVNQSHIGS